MATWFSSMDPIRPVSHWWCQERQNSFQCSAVIKSSTFEDGMTELTLILRCLYTNQQRHQDGQQAEPLVNVGKPVKLQT